MTPKFDNLCQTLSEGKGKRGSKGRRPRQGLPRKGLIKDPWSPGYSDYQEEWPEIPPEGKPVRKSLPTLSTPEGGAANQNIYEIRSTLDPRILHDAITGTYSMYSQLPDFPRRWRKKGITWADLPEKLKRKIDENAKNNLTKPGGLYDKMEQGKTYTTNTPPQGTQFLPISQEETDAAEKAFNNSLAGAAQRKASWKGGPDYASNPAIHPQQKLGNVTILPSRD